MRLTADLIALCEPVGAAGAVYMCEPRQANLERAQGGGGSKRMSCDRTLGPGWGKVG